METTTTNQEDKIIELFLQGMSDKKIGKALDLDAKYVKEVITKQYFHKSRRPKPIQIDLDELRELAKTMTLTPLAQHYGADPIKFRSYLISRGIKYKTGKRGRKVGDKKQNEPKTENAKAIVEELKREGRDSYEVIAKRYGVTRQAVGHIYQRYVKENN